VHYDPVAETPPVAILWFDPSREWESILPLIRKQLIILTLGEHIPEERSGPAIWIRCMLTRVLEDRIPAGTVPVIYFPGIDARIFLEAEKRPESLQPLADLIFRGYLWVCEKGTPWSVDQFFRDTNVGPGVKTREDDFTRKAMLRALPNLCDLTIPKLKEEEPWKAKDFDALELENGIEKLIEIGEHALLEFKASGRWNIEEGKPNPKMEFIILKTVAGFMNSIQGGTLLIGVHDNKDICGIELDYLSFAEEKRNADYYERWLNTLITNEFGKEFAPQIHISFFPIKGKTVCRIRVSPAPKPALVNDKQANSEIFYLRVGNATNPLKLREVLDYYKVRWESKSNSGSQVA
jgi:hypothetical protein